LILREQRALAASLSHRPEPVLRFVGKTGDKRADFDHLLLRKLDTYFPE
jgi:hypothetical protein